MEFALKWYFGTGSGIWSLLIVTLAVATWGFKRFNHQTVQEKVLNTGKFIFFACVGSLIATGGEVANGDLDRLFLPIMGRLITLVVVVAADWLSFGLYCMAHHPGGYDGWLREHAGPAGKYIADYAAKFFKWRGLRILVMLVLVSLVTISCNFQSPPTQALTLEATYEAEGTARAQWTDTPAASPSFAPTTSAPMATYTPTPSAPASPSATPTSSIIEVTPCGYGPCEIATPHPASLVLSDNPWCGYDCDTDANRRDIDILARLCVVEVRGFGEVRDDACASVVSTVFARIFNRKYSDGEVDNTITWGCNPKDGCRQFPGFVVNGCDGILPIACPWHYPADIVHFRDVVDHYSRGRWGPGYWCSGFLYYDSRPTSLGIPGTCIIRAANGQYEVFHN